MTEGKEIEGDKIMIKSIMKDNCWALHRHARLGKLFVWIPVLYITPSFRLVHATQKSKFYTYVLDMDFIASRSEK